MEDREDSEDDQFFFSRAPRMPEDDIIRSEVAILTGGRDQHGRPIIALPAKYHNILESKVKASGMDSLLRYFIDITRVADRKRGFVFVTDLRFSTLDFILLMKSILNSIQAEMKGAIGSCVLYVILPLNKKTNKDTLTHLALRQSRKKTNKNIIPPYFQSVAVDDEVELYNYIEKSHLTPDLGGYLQYSHQEWVAFRRIVEPFFANFESVQVRLSNVYQRLATMGKTNAGRGKEQLKQAHDQLQDAYLDIKRGLQLDVVLDQCEDLLARFGSSDEDDVFAVLAQKPILKETKEMVEGCHGQLVAAKTKIEDDWEEMSGRITHALQIIEYREDVTRLLDWFKTRRERDLDGGPDVADNLSRAEMLCHHFETGLLAKAEEKFSKALEVVDRGERLVLIDNNNRSLSEIAQLFKTLKQDAQDFQDAVQKHRHVLQSVYQFHQLYNRARRWYVSCIRFLPSDLCDLHSDLRSLPRGPDHRALKLQWEEDIRRFLHKQPLLAKEELKRVKAIPEDIGATSLRKKGRLLSYRCLILTNLLSHIEKVSSANVKDILKWQSEMNLRSDDSASQQSEVAPSDDRKRKTPLDSSHDTERNNQRHRRSQNTLKKTNDDNDSHHRGTQTPDKARRPNGPSDTHPDTPSNTVDTNNDDPLIQRLGHRGSFYDRYGDTQGQTPGDGYDEADGRQRRGDKQGSKHGERLLNGAVEHAQQLPPSQQTAPATRLARDRSQSSQPAPEHGQTYGIYGDSDVEGDTAVVIHHQGPPHGLPEHLLPGNQILHRGHASSESPHYSPSSDPSNVALGDERLSYGLIQQDPTQFQSGYTNSRHAPQFDAHGVHPQIGHTPQHASLYTHHNGTPANLNTNNNSSPSSKFPDSQGDHPHPSLLPSFVNGVPSPKRSPTSFHGSLMNIHQPHLDDSSAAGGWDRAATMNSSPVARHRSLVNLGRSPITDQTSVQYNSVETSPARSVYYVPRLENRMINTPLPNGETYSAQEGIQNPYNPASLRMAHGVSEPSVNVALRDTASPYSQVLANLMQLREANTTGPLQLARTPESSKKARTLPSRHSLSRSEMDLRYVPQNHLPPNGLSHSRQISSNSLMATTDPSAALTSYDKTLGDSGPDPQVEYYKKLYSTSTPLDHFITASGRRKVDHTLDPSTHTWMHEVPSTHASHQERLASQIPNTSIPLSPLALLEMEVAMKTMDAEEAIKDDEYNEEQMRRQAVIDGILNQSESDRRSHDVRASQAQVSPYGHRGKSGMRQKHVNSLSSPRKADKNTPRKASHSDASRSRLYSPSNHKASVTPETFEFLKIAQSENGLGEHPTPITTSLGIRNATPIPRAPRQSVVAPRGLSRTERQLGLSTTLPQDENSRALHASNELDQKPTFAGEPGVKTSDRLAQVYGSRGSTAWNTAGESFGRLTPSHHSDGLLAQNEEVDWRQEHLRELGLPPRIQHPVMNPNPNLSKHGNQSEYNTGWRPQHLQELGVTSNEPLSSSRDNPTRSETRDNDWRRQHLIELGLSPDMHHSTLSTAPTLPKTSGGLSYSKKDWRHQHLLELGISPNEHLSLSGRNTTGVGSKSTVRRNHASELAVSPSLHQRPKPSPVESGFNEVNIAPMTRRLRGVLEGGHSPDDVEEIHQLAEETAKKSVRFAHLSEASILDGEEKAQDELAERLHQLDLKLQEEEYSLMYKDVLDGEKVSLDQQLRELDRQEEAARSHANHQQTGSQRLLEGSLQPIHLQNDYHHQQMVGEALLPRHAKSRLRDLDRREEARPSLAAHRGTHVGALETTRVQNGRPDQQIGQSVHRQMREEVLQPQHVERRQHFRTSQHPDAIVPGSPAKLVDAKYGQQSRSAAAPSQQQVFEEDAQPMLVQRSRQAPFTKPLGHQVLPESSVQPMLAQTGQPQEADQHSGQPAYPDSAETPKRVKTQTTFDVESKADRLSSSVGSVRDNVRSSPGSVRIDNKDRQSKRIEHKVSRDGQANVRESLDRVNISAANDKRVPGQDLTNGVGRNATESPDVRDPLFREAESEDQNYVNRGEQVVADQVVVPGRHASASESRQNSDSGLVESNEVVRNLTGSVSVLPDSRYGGGSRLVSNEEQNKAMEANGSETSALHPTRSSQALLDGLIDNPAVRDAPRHPTVVSVAPDSRHAGEKKLDHLTGELHESEKPVACPTKLPRTLGNSQDQKKDVSRSNSSEMIRELGDVIPSGDTERALLTERDHTAADYIACALGIDYVNKRNLTVQPYSNSSKHLDQSGNLSYSQSERSQDDATKDIVSPSTQNDSRPQNDSKNAFRGIRSSDKEGANMREFYNSHVELQMPQVSSEESPCSPIRKWLKEKETSEVLGMKSSRSEPNLTDRVEDEDPVNHEYTDTFELPINAVRLENPIMTSQSTSPMGKWLREKEELEARERRDVKDFALPNGSVIDGGLGNVSNGRPSTKSVELESSEDLRQSPSHSRGRTNSLIPVPVGSKRAGGSQKQMAKSRTPSPHEKRQSSSSAIPVSKSSSIGELSSSVSSAAGGKSPDKDQVVRDTMQKADIQSKKTNKYSKIPVKKVYRVLKDGGYLEDTSHPREPTSARQVSSEEALPIESTVGHSESDVHETQRSRPVLERQGTFTKESRPTLTREGTFTIEGDDDNRKSESLYFPGEDSVAATQTTDEKNALHSTFSSLALVLDHMVKKGGGSSTSTKGKTSGGKKSDSAEETFENSSTESSMSPTTKSTIITTNKPTTNLYNSRSYFINNGNRSNPNQGEVAGSKARGHEVGMETYDGLTESDRKEHEGLDENELERMMASKSQLAEIRNLEIENGHLAYERKEFEAHLIKNMQQQQVNASDEG